MSILDTDSFYFRSSYRTELRDLTPDDSENLHQLAVAVNWPHRPYDMAQLLGLGSGVLAVDEIARPVGAGMYLPIGAEFAMVGAMMTLPRLQTKGMGRDILRFILERCGDRRLRLNATTESWKLYRSFGFREQGTVAQYQGVVSALPIDVPTLDSMTIRSIVPEDLPDMLALDLAIFGAERRTFYEMLMPLSKGYLLEKDGSTIGFSLSRKFGRGRLIGPMIAPSEEAAMALISPLIGENRGSFLRLDMDQNYRNLGALLINVGMTVYDTVTPMTIGNGPFLETNVGTSVYVLASQTMG